jgi:hypothetical protein
MKSLFVMSVLFFGLNANAYKACSSAQWGEANDACESKCSGLGHGTCHYATSCGIGIFGGWHADCSCGGMATYGGPTQANPNVAKEDISMPNQPNPNLHRLKAKLANSITKSSLRK